jgi:hypothetical protein
LAGTEFNNSDLIEVIANQLFFVWIVICIETTDSLLATASAVVEGSSIFAAYWQTQAFTGQRVKERTFSAETLV